MFLAWLLEIARWARLWRIGAASTSVMKLRRNFFPQKCANPNVCCVDRSADAPLSPFRHISPLRLYTFFSMDCAMHGPLMCGPQPLRVFRRHHGQYNTEVLLGRDCSRRSRFRWRSCSCLSFRRPLIPKSPLIDSAASRKPRCFDSGQSYRGFGRLRTESSAQCRTNGNLCRLIA